MRLSRTIAGLAAGITVSLLAFTPAFAATNTYTVQPGDTLWKIAKADGLNLQALENANPTVQPRDMLIGTVLSLPSSASDNSTSVTSGTSTSANSNATSTSATSNATSGNLYWMEHIINAEAGGQSLQTQIAVGDVIVHRMEAGTYGGNTVYDVVFQKSNGHYQFTPVENGYINNAPNASSIQAAKDVLESGTEEVPGALVFYNPAHTPAGSWVWSQPEIARVGSMVFAK